ncbi:MAG: SprT family zinc-dependent metalloprotease [Proteobacteria bacterium]|nr:SprT family zinc-dependent metalloprotease [Pseudomonadota bacterium]
MDQAARQLALFSATEEPDNSSGFSVRENSRARRLSIKVFPRGRVEVVVPKRTRPDVVQAFVREHHDWINAARASFATRHPPEPFVLPDVVDLPAIGQPFRIRYERPSGGKSVRYRSQANVVVLSGRTGDDKLCVAALRRWLAGVARQEFAPRLDALSGETGNAYKKMHIRGQRTCWGSHSATGTISINYCLLFLEPAIVRYLMIHELCHARHMNHSARFWKLLCQFEPDYKRLDRALSNCWNSVPVWVGIN